MHIKALQKKLDRRFGGAVSVTDRDGCTVLSGRLSSWAEVIAACRMAVVKERGRHVVNDIVCDGNPQTPMRLPKAQDLSLDGKTPDVLIIGGGISGASIARELTRYRLDVLLVDKESDLAMQASGRNDGEVHPGVDLSRGSLKQHYVLMGNRMYEDVCRELDVPFTRHGQSVGLTKAFLYPAACAFAFWRRHVDGVTDTKILRKKALHALEPNLNPDFAFAIYNPSAGCVCPYGLTIAYGENAVTNGAAVALSTAVTGMEVKNGRITAVSTNRGTIYPRLVINAAGTFAEDVAGMAQDRFYSIHPRRGTNSILDKKAGALVSSIASIKGFQSRVAHTKGGGILHTVHDNLLVGPNAVKTPEKEDFSTARESIEAVFSKQKTTAPALSERDIITYFTGVRACTFEEDFIIEPGRKTENLIHCAGIQSPGLTTAPAVAIDVAAMAKKLLEKEAPVEINDAFDPRRKGIPHIAALPPEERAAYIRENPDYGEIVCRCEEISRGEIRDALRSPICVPTLDGVKKRVRPGMGRCQGGFCQPLVTKIISEFTGVAEQDVTKSGNDSFLTFGSTKGGSHETV